MCFYNEMDTLMAGISISTHMHILEVNNILCFFSICACHVSASVGHVREVVLD